MWRKEMLGIENDKEPPVAGGGIRYSIISYSGSCLLPYSLTKEADES